MSYDGGLVESAEAVQDVVSFSSNVFARVTFGSVYSVDMGNDTLGQTRVSSSLSLSLTYLSSLKFSILLSM